ncbi:LURP-one-related/scramblase family protein [Rubripirellula reticaptiva]|uniref:Uncharacterized protein n=1 Tax=Rubripirellula reticaptiva TaxID=2528013 RepID=A0A5C6F386_9BACT|nr:hypothetical protein [Rubripirellula reticaptiva]TWU55044.1 hypothetical protein Poly59_13370 [Rubripirellula reticaptiva]
MSKKDPLPSRRYLDMWALPGMHPSNVGIMQQMTTADSNHFTTHMDSVGTVSEQDYETGAWERTHMIGLRTDVWKVDGEEMEDALSVLKDQRRQRLKKEIKKNGRLNAKQQQTLDEKLEADEVMSLEAGDIEKRRLILKLFKTSTDRVRWCGTIEQVTMTEVHNSIGSRRNLLTMVVMLPRSEHVTYIQQNHRTFRIPSVFTFGFYDGKHMHHVELKRKWISIGADFDVNCDGESIGEIDGRLFSFGADSYVDVDAGELSENTGFVDLMTLFTASVGYHKAMRKSVDRRVKATLSGQSHCHVVCNEELRLRHNGRAAA